MVIDAQEYGNRGFVPGNLSSSNVKINL